MYSDWLKIVTFIEPLNQNAKFQHCKTVSRTLILPLKFVFAAEVVPEKGLSNGECNSSSFQKQLTKSPIVENFTVAPCTYD